MPRAIVGSRLTRRGQEHDDELGQQEGQRNQADHSDEQAIGDRLPVSA